MIATTNNIVIQMPITQNRKVNKNINKKCNSNQVVGNKTVLGQLFLQILSFKNSSLDNLVNKGETVYLVKWSDGKT